MVSLWSFVLPGEASLPCNCSDLEGKRSGKIPLFQLFQQSVLCDTTSSLVQLLVSPENSSLSSLSSSRSLFVIFDQT